MSDMAELAVMSDGRLLYRLLFRSALTQFTSADGGSPQRNHHIFATVGMMGLDSCRLRFCDAGK